VSDLGTDSAALQRRMDAHERFARHEINDWILGIVRPRPGEMMLDLGCGTGKQLLPIAALVGETGLALGLDASAEALAVARAAAEAAGRSNVRLVQGRMDDLARVLPPGWQGDLVVCCFSLYYAAQPERTVREIRRRLSPGGRCFVCGPARENNGEFLEFCDAVIPRAEQTHRRDDSLAFMDDLAPVLLRSVFARVDLFRFENPIVFPTADDVLAYWRSYHLYSAAHEQAFKEALGRHFASHGRFVTRKVVQGALAS
jgi:SAM-dependent methyltransferase